jgi:RNA polymerase sigma-70 factor (ECF subfamily)
MKVYVNSCMSVLTCPKGGQKIRTSDELKEDSSIISQFIKTGEYRFFEVLVNRYKNRVFRLVASILGPGRSYEAEDVSQEIFIKIFQNLQNFNVEKNFWTWLYRIAYNTAIDFRRKAKYHLTYLDEGLTLKIRAGKRGNDPYNTTINREQQRVILACMQELPDIVRSALYLFYWLGHSTNEIAELLGINAETVKSYLYRGRHQLYRKLKKRGIAHE